MKFTHLTVPRESLKQRLIELAAHSGHRFPEGSEQDPISAVLGLGRHIIGKQLQRHASLHAPSISQSSLYEALETFTSHLVDGLESDLELKSPAEAKLTERIGKVRSRIHQLRTDPNLPPNPVLDGMADRAILALRVHGYTSPYLIARPTIDRYDETVERMAEDYHSRAMPRTGIRRALVKLHAPISMKDFLHQNNGSMKTAIPSLTSALTKTIQGGIDLLNETNDTPGAGLLETAMCFPSAGGNT